jgi:hypothetical protein
MDLKFDQVSLRSEKERVAIKEQRQAASQRFKKMHRSKVHKKTEKVSRLSSQIWRKP